MDIVVTLGHANGTERPVLTRDDFTVSQHYDPLPVTNLVPLRGAGAELELFLLIDNCSSCEPGSKFEELRHFISSQPSTTSVGVAYIRNGRLEVAENPTQDHERAVKALSTPDGSNSASPFSVLTALIHDWRQGSSRRAVLMVSNGIDPAPEALQDASAEAAIEAAQRAGVTIYMIIIRVLTTLRAISPRFIQVRFSLPTLRLRPAGKPTSWVWGRCLH